jgi:putative membrane protein
VATPAANRTRFGNTCARQQVYSACALGFRLGLGPGQKERAEVGRTVAGVPLWEPQPGVWVVVASLAAGYAIALSRLGPGRAGGLRPASRRQMLCWYLGVVTVWLAVDGPVDTISERSMLSVHVIQHALLGVVAAPLLLLGTPAWLARWVLRPRTLLRTVRWLARFLPAVILYNVVVAIAYWPAFVDLTLRNDAIHFLEHGLILLSCLIVWLPVFSPLPEIPRLSSLMGCVFIFMLSILPTVPASFLTFGNQPLYHFYEHVPHLWGFSTLADQRLAGIIVKLGVGLLLWSMITAIFFQWAAEENQKEIRARHRRSSDSDQPTRIPATSHYA